MRRGWVWPIRPAAADQARRAQTERQADFRQLRGFTGAGFAAQDNDRVIADGGGNGVAVGIDRQAVVKIRLRQRGAAFAQASDGSFDLSAQLLQSAINRFAITRVAVQAVQTAGERGAIPSGAFGQAGL